MLKRSWWLRKAQWLSARQTACVVYQHGQALGDTFAEKQSQSHSQHEIDDHAEIENVDHHRAIETPHELGRPTAGHSFTIRTKGRSRKPLLWGSLSRRWCMSSQVGGSPGDLNRTLPARRYEDGGGDAVLYFRCPDE